MDFHRSSFKLKLDLWYSFRNSNGKHLNNMSTMHVISLTPLLIIMAIRQQHTEYNVHFMATQTKQSSQTVPTAV